MTIATQFPDHPRQHAHTEILRRLAAHGFVDSSWHCDLAPSVYHAQTGVTVFLPAPEALDPDCEGCTGTEYFVTALGAGVDETCRSVEAAAQRAIETVEAVAAIKRSMKGRAPA